MYCACDGIFLLWKYIYYINSIVQFHSISQLSIGFTSMTYFGIFYRFHCYIKSSEKTNERVRESYKENIKLTSSV